MIFFSQSFGNSTSTFKPHQPGLNLDPGAPIKVRTAVIKAADLKKEISNLNAALARHKAIEAALDRSNAVVQFDLDGKIGRAHV